MSSPLSPRKRGVFADSLIGLHQKFSHHRRIEILASHIAGIIGRQFPDRRVLHCLDVGCGDMGIADRIGVLLPNTDWTCIDIHDVPVPVQEDLRWRKYRKFDGVHIPFPDNSIDVLILCDVLHHSGTDMLQLMTEAGRTAQIVIVKDHLEYSLYSRLMLWALDFVGNWSYGIKLPSFYFTVDSFQDTCRAAGLQVRKMETGIDLYAHMPLASKVLRKSWQFIAVLAKRSVI